MYFIVITDIYHCFNIIPEFVLVTEISVFLKKSVLISVYGEILLKKLTCASVVDFDM